ncbi:MAG: hypothetical protein JSU97_01000, partial [Dehalococcoidia bacterium]
MRKAASKLRWRGKSVLVALTLAIGVLGLLLLGSSAKAQPPRFNATVEVDVVDTNCTVNSDIDSTFTVQLDPAPSAQYTAQVSFTPNDWGVAEADDVPIGAIVGQLDAIATLGLINSPCTSILSPSFTLMNCTLDKSDPIPFDDQILDNSPANGINDGCDRWPDFLDALFPGLTPIARMAGFTNLSGVNLSLNFLIFEPGTTPPAPGLPASFSPDLGYPSVSVLNDPAAPLTPDLITDNCPPLLSATTYYGLTKDKGGTAEDESGYEWRTNPLYSGTYTFSAFAASIPDADHDNIDNELDTCPHIPCSTADQCDTQSPAGDDDGDGLDNDCDPLPGMPPEKFTLDGDSWPNRQDNCPLVANEDQADSDFDGIGDACDQDDWNDDGDTDDPGEPTGFSPDVLDGERAEMWFATDIELSGPDCLEIGEDSDGDGFEDADEANLGSCRVDPCNDALFCDDIEAADSTPEDTTISGSCTDGLDNDLDGYVDDADGGCGDDTDGDGVSDDGEDDLDSDPDDANSTPEDASVCDVCADGVDNDGDEDIDAADAGCAAAPVTPTVVAVDTDGDTVTDDEEIALGSDPNDADSTPEDASVAGTCTDGVDNDGDGLIDAEDEGCAEATPSPTVEVEICAPVFPGTYSGLVRVDGQPAAAGYEVTASIDGIEWGSAIVSGGRYAVDIPDHMPSTEPCFEAGTITFTLN